MSRRVAAAALPLVPLVLLVLLLGACVAQEEQPPTPPAPTATASPIGTAAGAPPPEATAEATPPGPLSDSAVIALLQRAVCWYDDPALASACLPPGPDAIASIATMGASGDMRFVAPLIDMRWLGLGWERAVEDALETLTGARLDDPYAWYQLDYRPPVTPGYPEWKARLLSITATAETSPRFEELIVASAAGSNPGLLVWTSVQPNGVPPLRDLAVIHRLEERYLDPSDVVYGLQIEGEARAYPRRIVAWHGVVNDVLGDTPILVAYCLPCGGAAGFDRRFEGVALSFGTSGLAFDGRTLLFDEQTLGLWDSFSGGRASGEGNGLPLGRNAGLDPLPLVTTTWGAWSELHPNTTVLSLDTGHLRDYGAGAAIAEDLASADPLYPTRSSGELGPKQPVIGLAVGDAQRAYPVADLEARRIVHDRLAGTPIVLLSRGPGLGTRAYEAADLAVNQLEVVGEDLIAVDVEGERWFVNERALVSALDGREHRRLPLWQGYWFAWLGAFGSSEVWRGGS